METFRRSVVIARADAREPNEALESRWSGAGKVGTAGFDSAPGFASFSWMSDEEYEYYESTHEHEDADDEEDEHEEDDSADIQSFDGTTTAESAATLKPIERVDNESKILYAGIAAAAVIIGGRRIGAIEKRPQPPPMAKVTTSTTLKTEKERKVKERKAALRHAAVEGASEAIAMPLNVTRGATFAGVASGVLVAAAALGVGFSGSYSREDEERAPRGPPVDNRSAQRRLELLRESMILEFETEIEKLGALKKKKNDDLKTLNDEFMRRMKGVELGAMRQEAVQGAAAGEQSSRDLERVLTELKAEHAKTLHENEAAFDAREKAMQETIVKLQSALSIAEAALQEAKDVNDSMASRHETELRAARGLIRAERELGRSEASKYQSCLDLERAHVAALRSNLALTKVTSSERFAALQEQLKTICESYSKTILEERAAFAEALATKEAVDNNSSTAEAEFRAKISEIRAEAEAEVNSLMAKYDSALRSAAGERRALKALLDSEMDKTGPRQTNESVSSQIQGDVAAAEVLTSSKLNAAILDAQIEFEQRVVALKKTHNEELERIKRSADRETDGKIRALEEAHQISLKATSASHDKALTEARAEADRKVAEAEERARSEIA